jgi:hypothetical protein
LFLVALNTEEHKGEKKIKKKVCRGTYSHVPVRALRRRNGCQLNRCWLAGRQGYPPVYMLEAGLLAKPFTSSGGSLWKPIVETGEVSA